ncbi:MAG: MATE family efflux transporter [Candidatus Marinimicrobia bacterium]|nr:MATE family efflux transporter [Candidatus Neomarinimicrobiota bacterium]MBT7376776.1 MATE family efflux transporter [Candidatus Neomarinimicrobiota bacterium]
MDLGLPKESKKNEFIENPQKAMWKLAMPMMLGMSVQAIYMLVDTAFIGKWVGPTGLAAMGYIFPFMFFLMGITFGLGSGATSVIAKYIGGDRKKDADNAAEHTIMLGVFIYGIMLLVLYFAGEGLIKLQGADEAATQAAMDYFSIMILGSIFMILGVFFRSILSGEGDNVFPMKVLGVGTVLNIILDPFFIKYYGIKGAAAATIISQGLVFAIFVYYLIFKHHSYITFKLQDFKFNSKILSDIFKIGMPASLSMIIMSSGVLIYNVILDSNEAVAAYQTAGRIEHLFFLPIISIATALVTLVGMFSGANRIDLVKEIVKYGLTRSVTISVLFSIFFSIFNRQIISGFTNDPNIIIHAAEYFSVLVFAYPFITIGMTCSRVMQGLGHGTPMLILTILRVVVINSVFAWFFVVIQGKPVIFAWYSLLISCSITSVVSILWMRSKIKSFSIL